MKRQPFLIFISVIGLLVAGMLAFIQSAQFARVLKGVVARNLPSDMGIEGDFSDLAVKIFPPGISIRNPKVKLKNHNVIDLPEGSSIQADQLDLIFRPFQMLSGTIRVNEIRIVNGDVDLLLDPEAAKKKRRPLRPSDFQWDELFQIRAEAISAENTRFNIHWVKSDLSFQFLATSLRLGQWEGKGGLGYEFNTELRKIQGAFPKEWAAKGLPDTIDQINAVARVNAGGMQMDSLKLVSHGIEIETSGEVKGNLLSRKNLGLEVSLAASGDIGEVVRLISPQSKAPVKGRLAFKGKLDASLDRLIETARLDGTVTATEVQYEKWHADEVRLVGQWNAAHGGKGGELALTKATISSKETPRLGYFQPGSGGRIEAGPLKIALGTGSMAPISVPITLSQAHIHWLAAPAVEDVYPLDFRVTGEVGVTFSPKTGNAPWNLKASLRQLNALDFSLDNQKYGKSKPLRRVLKIPKITLDGDVIVDSSAVKPSGLTISMPRTKFQVAGKIDFKTGYDLYAAGPVQLEDLGELAQNAIKGSGILRTHVHGPSSRVLVDFDTDLDDAYYLDLKLGSLKGLITWDDDPSHLIFHNVLGSKRRSSYSVDGMLDLGEAETVNLKVAIPQADVQDFIQIFGVLTKDLWWFPKTLSGLMSGSATVTGGIDYRKLAIATRLSGTNWEYLGERVKTVALTGGYDQGRYQITELRAQKRTGDFGGRISYDADSRVDWDFSTRDFAVTDIDLLAQLDVPIRGRLEMQSTGSGKPGAIRSSSFVGLSDVSVRGVGVQASKLSVRTENGVARISGSAIGGQGILDAIYDFNPRNSSSIHAELSQLDFSPILLILNPQLSKDRALVGNATGSVQLTFNAGDIERASGKVSIADYQLRKTGTSFQLHRPVSFELNEGSFDIRDLGLRGNQGIAKLTLQSRHGQMDGAIVGDLDVSLVEFLSGAIAKASGTAELDLAIGGRIKAPTLFGRANLSGATLSLAALESPFENITGSVQLRQTVLTVQEMEADLAGGRVTTEGRIEVFPDRLPQIALKAVLGGNRIKVYPFQFAKVRGTLKLHGTQLPYLVDGAVTVEAALSKEKVLTQRQAEGLKAARYTPPPRAERESDYPLFRLNINAAADQGILVQNDLFDIEMKGNINVLNTIDAPRMTGTAEVLHGRMVFKDHSFQIQSASVKFDNPTVINPAFNLISSTDVNGTKIQLYAAGRIDKWKIELSSNPVMPESEILSLLALGMTSNDTRRLRAEDRSVFERGEAASLLLHSLDFNREVQAKTGIQIQLDESVNTQLGTSAFRPSSQEGSNAAAPKIVIKRRIGKQLDVSYGSTVGLGTSNQREVNAELHVTPGFSILGVWDNFDTFETDSRNSYGLDLKVQKRFK